MITANDDKLQDQSNDPENAESNAERDRDAGNMNNGTIGGNMDAPGDNDESANQQKKDSADAANGQIKNG